ncbi:MAG TPA: CHASE3 domain-containing protein [Terriglobales bacterium]|nr:CHASE3 domain-containing protein [Terriglobales bacterium]
MTKRAPALTIAVILVLAALIVSGTVFYHGTQRLIAIDKWVSHTQRVLTEVEAAHSLISEAENAERGCLLTHDLSHLEPYRQAAAQLPRHLRELERITADHAEQHSRAVALGSLAEERLAIFKDLLAREEQGDFSGATAALLTGRGRENMEQVRGVIQAMALEENRLLEARTTDAYRTAEGVIITFVAGALAAVVLVLIFYLVARREVRNREEVTREIAEREAWLHTTLRSIGDAVIATDEKGRVKFLNAVAEQLTGFATRDAEGLPIEQVFRIQNAVTRASLENPVERVLRFGESTGVSNQSLLLDRRQSEIPIQHGAAPISRDDGKVLGVVLVFRDVTQQRRMEESARKSEKLAAAGRLAATIAHEINNPLEAVMNLLYLARTSKSLESAQNYLVAADRELSRVAHIARQTLGFYRDSAEPVTTKASALLDEVLAVYESRMRAKQIIMEKDYQDELPIHVLRGEMVQVISNLVANALDAMPTGGHLRLRTSIRPGGVELEIQDDGVGIPAAHIDKIFDAFFTTKTDVGTGLGLWVVKDLMEKQGGTVSVSSSNTGKDSGTRFVLFIPLIAADVRAQRAS